MKWIKLKDRRPKEGQLCLVYFESADPKMPFRLVSMYLDGDFLNIVERLRRCITHWMPFPKGPK